jgi:UDP-glucose 4-epimerase
MLKWFNEMNSYLVTGGAGFIGSNIAAKLIDRGDKVYIIDDLSSGFEHNIPSNAIFIKGDISDQGTMLNLPIREELTAVFHFAAQPSGERSFDNPYRDINVNLCGTYNTLMSAKKFGSRRFIFASSMSVYGDVPQESYIVSEDEVCQPTSYYGINKFTSEKVISIFSATEDIRATSFRIFNTYGPGQNMLNMKQGMASIYISYLINNKKIQVKGSLDRFRDFIFIDDVVDVFINSENDERTFGQVFNLGTGIKTTVKNLLELIMHTFEISNFDDWVYVQGCTKGDILGCVANTTKIELMGWKPQFDLETGLKQMRAWVNSNAS